MNAEQIAKKYGITVKQAQELAAHLDAIPKTEVKALAEGTTETRTLFTEERMKGRGAKNRDCRVY